MPPHDIDDVGPCNDFLDEGLWYLAAYAHGRESSGQGGLVTPLPRTRAGESACPETLVRPRSQPGSCRCPAQP
jgi:hypothetical protein